MAQNIRLTDENREQVEKLCTRLQIPTLNKLVNHMVENFGPQLDELEKYRKDIDRLERENKGLRNELSSIGTALSIATKYGERA